MKKGRFGLIELALTIFILAYCSASSLFWDSVMSCWVGRILKWFYSVLPKYPWFSILIAVLLLVATIWIGRRWFYDKDVRWYRPLLLFLGIVLINVQNTITIVDVIEGFSYGYLFTILMGGLFLTLVAKQVKLWKEVKNKNIAPEEETDNERIDQKVAVGFTNDDTSATHASEEQQNYAHAIVDHLLGTDTRIHSFAIGITGDWGVGKSTFLEVIEKELEGKADVVRFNPWMCRTPEQVADDFFVALRQQLSTKYSTLSRPISDYARYINNTTFNLGGDLWSKLTLNIPHESLQEKKNQLSKRFLALNQPVVVVIDDLDRLEQDEVFEVLRLIRNTADLSNVIYVVAYDKKYVTAVLSEKKIKDATAYLEKIFPVEIHQPKVEVHELRKVFEEELSNNPQYGEELKTAIMNRIDQESLVVLFDILNNYRRVKRFVRLYLLNVDYLMNIFSREIKLMDLFWMELLQVYDKGIYEELFEEPLRYLYIEDEQYHLRPGIYKDRYYNKKEQSNSYKGESVWNPKTDRILYNLFENPTGVTNLSMRHVENYKKYFTFGVSKMNISVKEVKQIFDNDKRPEDVVRQWIDGKKYVTSILFQLRNIRVEGLQGDSLRRYIVAVLESAYMTVGYQSWVKNKSKMMLKGCYYSQEQKSVARGYFLQWCYEKMKEDGAAVQLSKLLSHLYITLYHDEDGGELPLTYYIYTNSDIESLLKEIMINHLKNYPDLTAVSIMQEKSLTGKLFSNCTVLECAGTTTDEFDKCRNVAFDLVILHFEKKQNKPSLSDYDRAFDNMFLSERPEGEIDDYDYEMYIAERLDDALTRYFGSDNELINRFKEKCFVQ